MIPSPKVATYDKQPCMSVQGVADISAIVHGLPQEDNGNAQAHVLTLRNLPFQGSFRVGGKGF